MLTSEKQQISVICPSATSCENYALPPEEADAEITCCSHIEIVMLSEERACHRWPVDFAEKIIKSVKFCS
eukprot:s968_g36.t1